MTAPERTAEVAVVIVNFNVRDLLRECLLSLRATTGVGPLSIWVVDSGSVDGSADMVRAEFPEVHLLAEPRNLLYVRANNLGLAAMRASGLRPRAVLILNPDTRLPPTALRRLLDRLDEFPSVGAVGPRLELADGSIDWACRRSFPSPMTSLIHLLGLGRLFPRSRRFGRYRLTFLDERARAVVDSLVGAFMLVRADVLEGIGDFDDRFAMYGEDLDLCWRLRERGWRVLYDGSVDVVHHKRSSSAKNPRVRLEFYRAMLVFFRKHYLATTPLLGRILIEAMIGLMWARAARRGSAT